MHYNKKDMLWHPARTDYIALFRTLPRDTHMQCVCLMQVQSIVGLWPIVKWENEKMAKQSLVKVYEGVSEVLGRSPKSLVSQDYWRTGMPSGGTTEH